MVLGRLAFSPREEAHEVLDEERDVLRALAQRRHLDGDHGEADRRGPRGSGPARSAPARFWLVAAMTRTSTRERVLAADALEGAAPRARAGASPGSSSDMSPISSRKSVPPSASSNRPRRRATAPVNAPRSWPNSSDSISSSGMAAQLTSTNGPSRARRLRVDGARDQLLARAALAVDEDAPVGRRRDGDLLAQLLDEAALADDLLAALELLAQVAVLPLEPPVVERARGGEERLLERQGLFDEVVGAELGGLDGGLDGAVSGDHDDRGLGRRRLISASASRPSMPGIQMSRKIRSGVSSCEMLQGLRRRPHREDAIALVLQHPAKAGLDRPLVIHDQDVLARHAVLRGPRRPPGAPLEQSGIMPRPAARARARRAARSRSGCRAAGLSSTQIAPPWSVTIWWTIGEAEAHPLVGFVEK